MNTQASARSQENGLFISLLGVLLNLMGWIVLAWCLSIIFHCVGMAFGGWDGARPEKLLMQEVGYLKSICTQSLMGDVCFRWYTDNVEQHWMPALADMTKKFHHSASNFTWPDFLSTHQARDEKFHSVSHQFFDYVQASIHVTQLFVLRIITLIGGLPLFALFAAIGLTDGMVQRSLRRARGGRESALIYHHARSGIAIIFVGAWITYLLLPVSVTPEYILLPFAILFGFSLWLCAKSFKKYW